MPVSITRQQTRSVVPPSQGATDPVYRVVDACTASVGISPAVYVFEADTGLFSRIASAADMTLYGTDRAVAKSSRQGYYRSDSVTRDFPTLDRAKAFADSVGPTVKYLAQAYEALNQTFLGTNTETTTSSDE